MMTELDRDTDYEELAYKELQDEEHARWAKIELEIRRINGKYETIHLSPIDRLIDSFADKCVDLWLKTHPEHKKYFWR